jgi:hypothetical protein
MEWCEPHEERAGQRIEATRKVNGTPMCERCFRGFPVGTSEGEGSPTDGKHLEGRGSVGVKGFFRWARRRHIAVEAVPSS